MLVKFKSKACADLIMLEADARRVLQAMLGDATAKGIVQVADLPQALARLEAAVAQDEALRREQAQRQTADPDAVGQASAEENEGLPTIRLAQRAAPMLQMLRRCMVESADLVWGV